MIPVLGVPVINQPELLYRMVESIDVQVGKLVVIDNSVDGIVGDLPWEGPTQVIRVGHNLGVAASWNLIIKSNPCAAWWCLVNHDIKFGEGDLSRLSSSMDRNGGVGMLWTPSAWGLTSKTISRVGWFDENFIPAYFEDNDYVYRCGLMDVLITPMPATYSHVGSAVIKSTSRFMSENNRTFPLNQDYYVAKWGGGVGHEKFRTPFDKGGSPAEWHLDVERLAKMTWRT